jgi:Flp pilus assembly protein TadG
VRLSDAAAPVLTTERGGVLVIVAAWFPVLLIFLMFVVEVGNWFEHKRHLQLQADAGAFAGGGLFNACFLDAGSGSAAIETEARRYAGDPAWAGGPGDSVYNSQIGGSNRGLVTVRINRKTYEKRGPGPDDTIELGACSARMVDVKMTEADLPWFLHLPGFFELDPVPAINAHARVEMQQKELSAGSLPVGVPDTNPTVGRVYFVNEANGVVLASAPLIKTGVNGSGLALWDNSASPAAVPISTDKIGVRIALGGGSSTTCGDPLVDCYDLTSSTQGVVFIRGYSTTGSVVPPSAPIARDVHLFNGTCTDPYFTAGGCTIGVSATMDFGNANPPTALGATLTATMGGQTKALTFNPTTHIWESAAANYFTVNAGTGANPLINLNWEETKNVAPGLTPVCTTKNNNPCKGTIPGVQQTYAATETTSGPIQVAQVWQNGSFWTNSFPTGTNQSLVVKIAIKGTLKNAADVNDPIVALRIVKKDSGNHTQSVDCDNGYPNLSQEIAFGCRPTYEKNTGQPCTTQSALWASAQPWHCVAIESGQATNQPAKGLNTRIFGTDKPDKTSCPPLGEAGHNNWSLFETADWSWSDPRVLQVFLTPFGAFSGTGSNSAVPVTGFATFYVTGYTSQGSGFDPPQNCENDPVPNDDSGVIVGHFIKYVDSINSGSGGSPCDFNAFGTCVAVLTQ